MALLSCEKDIQIAPSDNQPKLVVDAEIENGRPFFADFVSL